MGKDFYENRSEFAEVLDDVSLDFDMKDYIAKVKENKYNDSLDEIFATVYAFYTGSVALYNYVSGESLSISADYEPIVAELQNLDYAELNLRCWETVLYTSEE